jgi:hypothetical protein
MTKTSLDNSVQLCAQCHNERYTDWDEGTHGKYDDPKAQCVECHDPHDPVITNISTLSPVPLRETVKAASLVPVIIFAGIIGLLTATIVLLRRRSYV